MIVLFEQLLILLFELRKGVFETQDGDGVEADDQRSGRHKVVETQQLFDEMKNKAEDADAIRQQSVRYDESSNPMADAIESIDEREQRKGTMTEFFFAPCQVEESHRLQGPDKVAIDQRHLFGDEFVNVLTSIPLRKRSKALRLSDHLDRHDRA